MMRALYSGVSGLQVHQVKMDVLSNDIANVNTIGYKKSTVTFQDLLSQTIAGAQAGTATTGPGGVNAQQIGLGTKVGAITTVTTQGAASTTGSSTDAMIEGQGYFTLMDTNGNLFYSRAGAFSVDSAGNLVNSANGLLVCDSTGVAINITTGSDLSIASDGTISYNLAGVVTTPGTKVGITTFVNPSGLTKVGNSMYTESVASGTAALSFPGDPANSAGTITAGALEMSNVDLAQSFVDMIIAERGYQANSKSIKTADEMLQTLINLKN